MLNLLTKITEIGKITLAEQNESIIKLVLPNEKYSFENFQIRETKLLKEAFVQLQEYFRGKRKIFEIPLNPYGTDFQKIVWKELVKIPYGKTLCYQQLSVLIKNPNAQRAVGNANNKNPIPIFIPCHRVIGKNGKLTGYKGGIDLKKYLLNLEEMNYICE